MTDSQAKQCHGIIHANAAAAGGIGAGLAQIPGSDNVALVALETTMAIELGKVFGQSVTRSAAASLVAGMAGTMVGRGVSQLLIGWIPGIGNAVNAATAAGVVETLGWSIAKYFDSTSGD